MRAFAFVKYFIRNPRCTAPLCPADQPTQRVRVWASIFLLSADWRGQRDRVCVWACWVVVCSPAYFCAIKAIKHVWIHTCVHIHVCVTGKQILSLIPCSSHFPWWKGALYLNSMTSTQEAFTLFTEYMCVYIQYIGKNLYVYMYMYIYNIYKMRAHTNTEVKLLCIFASFYLSNCDVIGFRPKVCYCNTFTEKKKKIKKCCSKCCCSQRFYACTYAVVKLQRNE